MVGPARKRTAVGHLQGELELSQRRACQVVGQPRPPNVTLPHRMRRNNDGGNGSTSSANCDRVRASVRRAVSCARKGCG